MNVPIQPTTVNEFSQYFVELTHNPDGGGLKIDSGLAAAYRRYQDDLVRVLDVGVIGDI